jgi:hypothetical protein
MIKCPSLSVVITTANVDCNKDKQSIIRKNNSSKWCNWCKLSLKEWAVDGHELGKLWTIKETYRI